MTRTEYLQLTAHLQNRQHLILEKYDSKIMPQMAIFFESIYHTQLKLFLTIDATMRYDMKDSPPGWEAIRYRIAWALMGMKYALRMFIRRKRDEMHGVRG